VAGCCQKVGKPNDREHKIIDMQAEAEPLVAAGLVGMGPHPDFTDDFKTVWLTDSGRLAISKFRPN